LAIVAWGNIAECRSRLFHRLHVLVDEVIEIALSVADESADFYASQ
jgi:hypothetical protein